MRQPRLLNASANVARAGGVFIPHVKQLELVGCQARFDIAQRLAPRDLREGHDAKQVGTTKRANASIALVPLDNAPKVFHGTNSITCAKNVLPTFMCHSGSVKPESVANYPIRIQIVDTHESLKTRFSACFAASDYQINGTLLLNSIAAR